MTSLAGCGTGAGGAKLDATPQEIREAVVNPFSPMSIRIHPLTHIDSDAEGEPLIILHVELRDRWGDPVKGAGSLLVELYRPASGPAAGLEQQELVWEVDLSDLEQNARLYDPPTRTYRLQLTSLPHWVQPAPTEGATQRIRLRAVLTTTAARGEQLVLDDTYVLRY